MKGMLYTPANIQAIRDKRKMVTRRVIKPQPHSEDTLEYGYYHPTKVDKNGQQYPSERIFGAYTPDGEYGWVPRYRVGETVYIKEAWRILDNTMVLDDEVRVEYKADGQIIKRRYGDIAWNEYGRDLPVIETAMRTGKWMSSIHLPCILARYFIKITDVRAERLQEITEDDAELEGVSWSSQRGGENPEIISAVENYAILWDSINKEHQWESNPFVWRYEFKSILNNEVS